MGEEKKRITLSALTHMLLYHIPVMFNALVVKWIKSQGGVKDISTVRY